MTDNTSVADYASRVPGDIRRAVEGLASDQRMAIAVLLIQEGGLSFSEITEELDLHQQQVTNCLKKMQEGGLVVQKDVVEEGSQYTKFYHITEFGKRLLDKLFDSIQPRDGLETAPVFRMGNFGQHVEESYHKVETTNKTTTTARRVEEAIPEGGFTGGQPVDPRQGERPFL